MSMIDHNGRKFGRLTVIKYLGTRRWLCKCDCGASKEVGTQKLTSGNTASCGCLRREMATSNATIHGQCGSALYSMWMNMKQRCGNPLASHYGEYGGRGIRVCDEWLEFTVFMAWAIANGFNSVLQLDRRENSGPYSPGNCRFVTRDVNINNTRAVKRVVIFGETKTLTQWSLDARCHVSRSILQSRVRNGWDARKAISIASFNRTHVSGLPAGVLGNPMASWQSEVRNG